MRGIVSLINVCHPGGIGELSAAESCWLIIGISVTDRGGIRLAHVLDQEFGSNNAVIFIVKKVGGNLDLAA